MNWILWTAVIVQWAFYALALISISFGLHKVWKIHRELWDMNQ